MMNNKLAVSLLYALIYLGVHVNTYAQASSNGNLILELEQTTPIPVTKPISPPITTKPIPIIPTITSLSFSQEFLSFGFLVPGEPLLRNDTLTLRTTHKQGATLFLIQDKPLSAESSSVTDTSCDAGSCTSVQASVWKSPLTFGFGVRCENSESCYSDFKELETYRPLSTTTPAAFVKTENTLENVSLQYKLNIPASQPPLPYTNTVSYILVPNL